MKGHDEWFSSEDIEEQIERHLNAEEQTSVNTHLLSDLQHLAEDDMRRLADIRARLVEYEAGKMQREPIQLQRGQQVSTRLSRSMELHRMQSSSAFPVKMLSGLVAVLLIGSMLFAFANLGTHSKQSTLPHLTPVATSAVQDMHGVSTFLTDATSGKVLVDVKGHVRRPIASMTGIMTAVVAIEDADLNQYVTVDQATLDAVPTGAGTAGLHAGDRLQLHELLYGLLLSSGSDAALVVAQTVAGNPQRFVTMMNDEAHQLQLNDTYFSVPYSVSSMKNYSSAADLTRLSMYALQLSPFAQIVMEKEHVLAATAQNQSYHWRTTNTLLATYPGMNGIMMGADAQAGACMVFSVQKDNRVLVGAELHAGSYKELSADVTKLLKQSSSS